MDNDKQLDHEYDGIRESDNDLPNWWLNIFYVTIIFSLGYMIYYHWGGGGPGQMDVYNKVMAQVALEDTQSPAAAASITDDDVLASIKNQGDLAEGKKIYDTKCAACHGVGGAGGIGPNLTDDYWLHGGKPAQVANIIAEGVLDKGMVAWKTMLSKKEMVVVTAYIKSIHGSNPANAKAPQGNKE